jgi:hypothetical protein
VLVPSVVTSIGEVERLAELSFTKHKSHENEDNIHLWYGAVEDFRHSVTWIVQNSIGGTEY